MAAPPRLEQVITSLVEIFDEYASKTDKGKKCMLNKEELKEMLDKEVQCPELKGKISPEDIEKAMEVMDKNNDGEVDFKEFCKAVSCLAKCYYCKKQGKGGKRGKRKDGEQEDKRNDQLSNP
ncbi:S100 calcium binding protein W [Thalassophryne amazonica]|uniref:S100 calcium binding protein W n=1 Tax=Thalassophryne amazonica TaxID=390379 RepID=UPI0014708FC5|nr:S100 calcium binding protein W [Thalassophryne amazonica]